MYDAALGACGRQDLARTLEAVSLLRGSLDFSKGGEIAAQLQRLYLYCEERARQRKFTECEHILRELRKTWVQVAATPAAGLGGRVAATP
jgi:flagellin-specific chaperone FliS